MRGVGKKMLISILTSVIVFVTMVATTFAWVGIFTYASADPFQMNLKVSENANDYLTISATGIKGSFSDEANIIDIQKQILLNQNKWTTADDAACSEMSVQAKNKYISSKYSNNCTITPSSCLIDGNRLSDFYSINNKNLDYYSTFKSETSYLKFDIYLSVDTKEGIQETTEINSNVFLTNLETILEGTICQQKLTNLNPYTEMPSIPQEYGILQTIPSKNFFNINSANAVRFALSIFEPIDINEVYDSSENPIKTLIYHGGKQLPELNGDVYDLGGNLPEDYNTALRELLIVRPKHKNSVFSIYNEMYEHDLQMAIERGRNDLEISDENSKIWAKPSNVDNSIYLGVHNGVQTKMKISVYFWFEGWDSDCIIGINEKPVNLNLTFTAGLIE